MNPLAPAPLQVLFIIFRIRIIQKSGSQISQAPTEPVIKEDEDDSSDSSAAVIGGSNGSPTLPTIGGIGVSAPIHHSEESISSEVPKAASPDRETKWVQGLFNCMALLNIYVIRCLCMCLL